MTKSPLPFFFFFSFFLQAMRSVLVVALVLVGIATWRAAAAHITPLDFVEDKDDLVTTTDFAFTVSYTSASANKLQEFEGFGVSLCWWAVGVGGWSNQTAFDEVMDLFFDRKIGLGLNQVRYVRSTQPRP